MYRVFRNPLMRLGCCATAQTSTLDTWQDIELYDDSTQPLMIPHPPPLPHTPLQRMQYVIIPRRVQVVSVPQDGNLQVGIARNVSRLLVPEVIQLSMNIGCIGTSWHTVGPGHGCTIGVCALSRSLLLKPTTVFCRCTLTAHMSIGS
jgi:hypothetical protein